MDDRAWQGKENAIYRGRCVLEIGSAGGSTGDSTGYFVMYHGVRKVQLAVG